MTRGAETLGDFCAIATIAAFLAAEDADWEARGEPCWTVTRRDAFEARCDALLWREDWRDRIVVGLLSDDPVEFWLADQASRILGIDTFDANLHRIREDPYGSGWYEAWQQADTGRADQLVRLVHELLPVEQVATGPENEPGMDARWRLYRALGWTLQALADHVGVGGELLLLALRSPVTPNRYASVTVLERWPVAAWPRDARPLVAEVAESDPSDQVREHANAVLARSAD